MSQEARPSQNAFYAGGIGRRAEAAAMICGVSLSIGLPSDCMAIYRVERPGCFIG
jgi:hypothetical protein